MRKYICWYASLVTLNDVDQFSFPKGFQKTMTMFYFFACRFFSEDSLPKLYETRSSKDAFEEIILYFEQMSPAGRTAAWIRESYKLLDRSFRDAIKEGYFKNVTECKDIFLEGFCKEDGPELKEKLSKLYDFITVHAQKRIEEFEQVPA